MSSLIFPSVWCVMQVALIAVIGVAISRLLLRRHPALAACVTASATTTILLITALLPVSLPKISLPQATDEANVGQSHPDRAAKFTSESYGDLSPVNPASVFFDFRDVFSNAFDFTTGNAASSSTTYWIVTALATIAVGSILLGLLKYLTAVRYATWLKRHSSPIEDRRATRMLTRLAEQLSVKTPIALCESRDVAGAAVIGWRRPVIILPMDWRFWTNDQLLAVLAHELAHVVRGDFLWRLLANFTRVLHFYHPLMHWLANQLTLSQELAADQLAVEAVGNRDRYWKALSQLAMRQDDLLRLRTESIVLPALSTNLIRRIKMLRAKDCCHNKQTPTGLRGLATGSIVIVGVITMALRSSAEPLGSKSASKHEGRKSQPVTVAEESIDPTLFNRTPLDISLVGDNELGAFAIRLGELSRRPELHQLFVAANEAASQALQQHLALDLAPEVHFESVDYIAGMFQLIIKPAHVLDNSEVRSSLQIGGTSEIMIRFRDDVQWKEWIRRNFPDAEEKNQDGLTYFEYHLPMMGPAPLLIAARDSRTVVMSAGFDRLKKLVNKDVVHQTSPELASEWDAADGGLLTIVATDKEIEPGTPSETNPVAIAGSEILKNTRKFSVGIDVQENSNSIALQCGLICEDESSAELVREAMDRLIPAAIGKLADDSKSLQPSEAFMAGFLQFWSKLFENSSITVAKRSDSSFAVEIRSTAIFPLRKMEIALATEPDRAVVK